MAFILTIVSGLSTMIGALLVMINYRDEDSVIATSLAFSAGVMISVSIFDLIKESLNYIDVIYLLLSMIIGVIISYTLNKLIDGENKLYRVGVMSMLGIIIHNIPEGIITFIIGTKDIRLGIILAISIALHNIPEGISIAIPIYYAKKSRGLSFLYVFIASISEVLGATLAYFLLGDISNTMIGIILAIVSGIMLYISFIELIPTAIKYKNKKNTLIAGGVGFIIMLLSIILI